jgi:hypothetical protein
MSFRTYNSKLTTHDFASADHEYKILALDRITA